MASLDFAPATPPTRCRPLDVASPSPSRCRRIRRAATSHRLWLRTRWTSLSDEEAATDLDVTVHDVPNVRTVDCFQEEDLIAQNPDEPIVKQLVGLPSIVPHVRIQNRTVAKLVPLPSIQEEIVNVPEPACGMTMALAWDIDETYDADWISLSPACSVAGPVILEAGGWRLTARWPTEAELLLLHSIGLADVQSGEGGWAQDSHVGAAEPARTPIDSKAPSGSGATGSAALGTPSRLAGSPASAASMGGQEVRELVVVPPAPASTGEKVLSAPPELRVTHQ